MGWEEKREGKLQQACRIFFLNNQKKKTGVYVTMPSIN